MITQDTTLDSDLLACGSPALTVAGDDVTLDLGGHIVDGPVSTGLSDDDERIFHGLVIEDGTVRGPLNLSHYEGVTVKDLTVAGITPGRDTDDVLLTHNVIRGSDGAGVQVGKTNSNITISDSLIERNGGGVTAAHSGTVVLLNNTIRANFGAGVGGGQGGDFLAIGNRIVENGSYGIVTNEGTMVLRDNVIAFNALDGTHSELGGISEGTNNDISHNGGSGVYSAIGGPRLTGNTVSFNKIDGVHLAERARGILVGNQIDRNGDDGIEIDDPSRLAENSLTGNHVWFNGDLGIEALVGTPGGGNWAKHNGNPLQCLPGSLCSTTGKPKSH